MQRLSRQGGMGSYTIWRYTTLPEVAVKAHLYGLFALCILGLASCDEQLRGLPGIHLESPYLEVGPGHDDWPDLLVGSVLYGRAANPIALDSSPEEGFAIVAPATGDVVGTLAIRPLRSWNGFVLDVEVAVDLRLRKINPLWSGGRGSLGEPVEFTYPGEEFKPFHRFSRRGVWQFPVEGLDDSFVYVAVDENMSFEGAVYALSLSREEFVEARMLSNYVQDRLGRLGEGFSSVLNTYSETWTGRDGGFRYR